MRDDLDLSQSYSVTVNRGTLHFRSKVVGLVSQPQSVRLRRVCESDWGTAAGCIPSA